MERIDVVHLDKWVADLLRSVGYKYQIRYWGSDSELQELWETYVRHRQANTCRNAPLLRELLRTPESVVSTPPGSRGGRPGPAWVDGSSVFSESCTALA